VRRLKERSADAAQVGIDNTLETRLAELSEREIGRFSAGLG